MFIPCTAIPRTTMDARSLITQTRITSFPVQIDQRRYHHLMEENDAIKKSRDALGVRVVNYSLPRDWSPCSTTAKPVPVGALETEPYARDCGPEYTAGCCTGSRGS